MKRSIFPCFLGALAISCLLPGCGGGGGGGSTIPTPPAPTTLPLTVKVNNVAVAPVAGNVVLGNGDTVSVEADRAVTWVASTPGALVTNNVVTAQSWTARLAKQSAAAANYSLQATAGALAGTVSFTIAQGDVRNGEYKLFSTNANEYRLRVDFDTSQYSILSGTATVSSSNFSAPVDGTYTFNVPGYAPMRNNARFRTAAGMIVGAHPVGGAEAQPFVAANNFVTAAADLPLTNMWFFLSDVAPTTVPVVNSRILSVRLQGSQITYCSVASGPITTVASCLPGNLSTNALTFNADRSITWDDAGSPVNMHVVRAEGELILVRAQSYAATGVKRFQIGLDDTKAIVAGEYEGGISNGSWGTTSITATTFRQSALTSAVVPDEVSGTLSSAGVVAAPLRSVQGSDGVPYFVQNTAVMEAHIAARGSAKAGLVAFGLKR